MHSLTSSWTSFLTGEATEDFLLATEEFGFPSIHILNRELACCCHAIGRRPVFAPCLDGQVVFRFQPGITSTQQREQASCSQQLVRRVAEYGRWLEAVSMAAVLAGNRSEEAPTDNRCCAWGSWEGRRWTESLRYGSSFERPVAEPSPHSCGRCEMVPRCRVISGRSWEVGSAARHVARRYGACVHPNSWVSRY